MSETSGINQYLKNNSAPLTSGNYSETDALVFSRLSYFKFENIYEDLGNTRVSVQDFADEVLKREGKLSQDEREFLTQLKESDRYAACTIHDFAAENTDSQWAAMTVDINDGGDTSVIAMRGTDGSTLGWTEDLELLYSEGGTNAQKLSAEYLENSKAENIYMTGHSKGGSDVTSGYVMASEEARSRVQHIDNFDGPGMNKDFMEAYGQGYQELGDKLTNYYPEDSVIGLLLNDNPGETHFISADVRPEFEDKGLLGQHDLFALELGEDGHLEETKQSRLSDFIDETLDGTVGDLSQAERASLVTALEKLGIPSMIAGNKDNPFANNEELSEKVLQTLYETGFIEEGDINKYKGPLQTVISICEGVSIYRNMTDEEKDALIKTAALLVLNGAREGIEWGIEELQKKVNEITQNIADTFAQVGRVVKNKAREIADGLNEIKNKVTDAVKDTTRKATSWLKDRVNDITGGKKKDKTKDKNKGGSQGGLKGPANFSVELGALQNQRQLLDQCVRELGKYYDEVGEIQKDLGFSAGLTKNFRLKSVKNSLSTEKRKCAQMRDLLTKAENRYRKNERTIIENTRIDG